ncbi:MAG: YihY/virulence factor BrkB family protein [Verrucomicrobiota bacterium]|nr:YihY/virulence factor BrkB family protein [Verrucomicrobiota bacterium]
MASPEKSFLSTLAPKNLWGLLITTFNEWLEDKAPMLGAALAYYTVFSLAPLILVLLAIIGMIFRKDPAGAWQKITEQMSYVLDQSGVQVVQDIAKTASKPSASVWATVFGVALALFGASGVFGQLQEALNTIWGVKAKPGAAIWDYIRIRFLSFGMVAGVCFLLLVTLTAEAVLKGFSHYVETQLPGGAALAFTLYLLVDLILVILLFGMMFRYLPDVEVEWRDVWVGSVLTAILFLVGKWALGLYLGSGAAGTAYGAASSLVTLLLWIYYSSQILLFGAEFTQVYSNRCGSGGKPSKHAVCIATTEKEISAPGKPPTPQVKAQVEAEAEAAKATEQ